MVIVLGEAGCELDHELLILFVFECIVAGESMDVVFANLAWSLYWAYLGVHPDRCPKGILYTTGVDFDNALTPLAGVFFSGIVDPSGRPRMDCEEAVVERLQIERLYLVRSWQWARHAGLD